MLEQAPAFEFPLMILTLPVLLIESLGNRMRCSSRDFDDSLACSPINGCACHSQESLLTDGDGGREEVERRERWI
jgi:hypothetical protein